MTTPDQPAYPDAGHPQQPPGQPADPAPTPAAARRRWPWIAAGAAVVLAGAAGLVYALMPSDNDEAVQRCQDAISQKLRSPSTAEYTDPTVASGDGRYGTRWYDVSGKVDAQNAFGATIRAGYQCELTRGRDGQWTVTSTSVA